MKDGSQPSWQLELDEIRSRYARRDKPIPSWKRTYYRRIRDDRETVYRDIVGNHFSNPEQLRFLEIGAGTGGNLGFFHSLGIPWRNIYANELLADRIRHLQNDFPSEMKVIAGNALDVSDRHFDLVLVSTVFSSILDDAFRTTLAARLLQMLSDEGIILWYDFVYQNPLNRDVRGIRESDVRSLFMRFANTILACIAAASDRTVGRTVLRSVSPDSDCCVHT